MFVLSRFQRILQGKENLGQAILRYMENNVFPINGHKFSLIILVFPLTPLNNLSEIKNLWDVGLGKVRFA